MFPILIILCSLSIYCDIYTFFNVDESIIPELRTALLVAVTLVCMTFILKIIGNVYMGMQLPAVSNLILSLGQTLALILSVILYYTNNATFLNIVVANTAAPLIVYILSYPYTFYIKFPQLRPTIKGINLQSALELGNIGLKFFWLQIAAIIQFLSANILIARFFSPEMVTPYQIAYRYMSIMMVFFTIICMPFWNATTDAYERGDMEWIRKASTRMNWITLAVAVLMVILVIISPFVYKIWVEDENAVSLNMTAMMALYILLMILSNRFSFFLNGVGALRLQLYMTISSAVFIPLAWIVNYYTHSIICFMAVMCFCNLPGLIANTIQFHKILNGTATGIWKI
jgi:O-antigen/teichoic acid export membrane protein